MRLAAVVAVSAAATAQVPEPGPTYGDAMRWYRQAAEAGDARAQFLLGLRFEMGATGAADMAAAAEWYRRAASQGHAEAQFKLAVMTEEGRGVARDPAAAAAALYGQAAAAGLAAAQYNLGVAYLNGSGVERDIAQAYGWVALAAEQGLAAAVGLQERLDGALTGELRSAATRRVEELRATVR